MLELTRVGLLELADHPGKLLDYDYDMFEPLRATLPAYRDYLATLKTATALAVDGKTKLPSVEAVRAEIYTPQDPSNQRATDLTKVRE